MSMLPKIPKWYDEWRANHLTTFACYRTDVLETFATWFPAFHAMGFTGHELARATRAMLAGPAPARIADHYQALKLAVAAERTDAERRKKQADYQSGDTRGICAQCGDSGMMSVPHPAHCNAQEWRPVRYSEHGDAIYATASVLCNCQRGRIAAARQNSEGSESKMKCMTIEAYEQTVNGNWSEQIAEHEAHREAVKRVESSETVSLRSIAESLVSRMKF